MSHHHFDNVLKEETEEIKIEDENIEDIRRYYDTKNELLEKIDELNAVLEAAVAEVGFDDELADEYKNIQENFIKNIFGILPTIFPDEIHVEHLNGFNTEMIKDLNFYKHFDTAVLKFLDTGAFVKRLKTHSGTGRVITNVKKITKSTEDTLIKYKRMLDKIVYHDYQTVLKHLVEHKRENLYKDYEEAVHELKNYLITHKIVVLKEDFKENDKHHAIGVNGETLFGEEFIDLLRNNIFGEELEIEELKIYRKKFVRGYKEFKRNKKLLDLPKSTKKEIQSEIKKFVKEMLGILKSEIKTHKILEKKRA